MDLRKLGSIFYVLLACAYLFVWYYLDKWGVVEWFAMTFVQPFMDYDAYMGVTIMGWIVLSLIGGPALKKEDKKS